MVAEIESGMKDFAALIEDILKDVKKKNENKHPKYFRNVLMKVWTPPVLKEFLTKDLLDHIRSAYDRGDISKETYATIFDIDFDVEVNRRMKEVEKGIDDLMFPHPTQNTEGTDTEENPPSDDTIPEDKKNAPEKKNYKSNQLKAIQKIKEYEEAPYKAIKDLPKTVKKLPKEGQKLWLSVFNKTFNKYEEEDKARKISWFIVKRKFYKGENNVWIKKK